MTETPHAALIAKLDNYREGVLARTMSWRSADEVGQILAEAIAALQATPAGIEGYRLSAAVSLCAFEKAEAQLAAQRTALEQLMADIRAETGNGRSLDYSAVADIRIEVWVDRILSALQSEPTSEGGQ